MQEQWDTKAGLWYAMEPNTGCHIWLRSLNRDGYGKMKFAGGTLAHRAAYVLVRGPIPEGLTIDHLCRVTCCVNPDHMEAVSIRENTLRGTSPIAAEARATHCKRGHEFTAANTYVNSFGSRVCRACRRLRRAEQRRTGLDMPAAARDDSAVELAPDKRMGR